MRRRKIAGAGVLLLAGALLLAACSGTKSPASSSGKAVTGHAITIKNFMYSPMSLQVKPGATITVTNKDSVTHTLSAQGSGGFNTGDIAPGQTKSVTAPMKPGTYHYICQIHQYMMGTIIVS